MKPERLAGTRAFVFGVSGAFLSVAGLLAACSKEQTQRYVYDLGNQVQCTQDARNLPDASSRNLACTSPAQSGRPSFDEYRKQTEESRKSP
jgi:hypothetical protein